MKVQVQLKETAESIEHDVVNTYQKGSFFCLYCKDGTVYKYPIDNIWRVVQPYKE